MLKYWIDPLTDHEGIHVHDIHKGKTYVATGKGGSAFSFANGRDLYVVTSAGVRAVGLERWFSSLEAALSSLARQAHDGTEPPAVESGTSPRDRYSANRRAESPSAAQPRSAYGPLPGADTPLSHNYISPSATASR